MLGLQLALGDQQSPREFSKDCPYRQRGGGGGFTPASGTEEGRRGGRSPERAEEEDEGTKREVERARHKETRRDGQTEAGDEMKPDKGRHLLNQAKKYWWTEEKRGMVTMATACQKHRLCN